MHQPSSAGNTAVGQASRNCDRVSPGSCTLPPSTRSFQMPPHSWILTKTCEFQVSSNNCGSLHCAKHRTTIEACDTQIPQRFSCSVRLLLPEISQRRIRNTRVSAVVGQLSVADQVQLHNLLFPLGLETQPTDMCFFLLRTGLQHLFHVRI